MLILMLLLLPFAYGDSDWRDVFPYLYIYDDMIQETNIIENTKYVVNDIAEITDRKIIEYELQEYIPDDSITYFVYDIPDKHIQKELVYESLNEWELLNPHLEFREVNDRSLSDIQIIFVETVNEYNEPESPTVNGYYLVMVDYIEDGCFYSDDTIKDSIKHEIGHTLGLGHSSDVNNLMWGIDGTSNFDDMGYVIPQVHEIKLDC